MEEQPQHLVLHVHNTFLNVTDLNTQARKMSRSQSDSSLSSSSVRQAQEQTDEEPLVLVSEGHWASTAQQRQSDSSISSSVASWQLRDVGRDADDVVPSTHLQLV